jgi:hypothetical protein
MLWHHCTRQSSQLSDNRLFDINFEQSERILLAIFLFHLRLPADHHPHREAQLRSIDNFLLLVVATLGTHGANVKVVRLFAILAFYFLNHGNKLVSFLPVQDLFWLQLLELNAFVLGSLLLWLAA